MDAGIPNALPLPFRGRMGTIYDLKTITHRTGVIAAPAIEAPILQFLPDLIGNFSGGHAIDAARKVGVDLEHLVSYGLPLFPVSEISISGRLEQPF
jgi:hypothetical protein